MRRSLALAVASLGFAIAAGCGTSAQQGTCGGQRTDTQSDPLNCGACGNACPTPLHAVAVCDAGACGRGACDPGWYDLDGTLGCEAGGEGVTAAPLPETGLVFQAFASGSSYGERLQGNGGRYTNVGVLGESTPPAVNGKVSETSTEHQNISGLNAIRPPYGTEGE